MSKMVNRFSKYLALIRWNKPIGSYLILWPVLTALWLASDGRPHAWVLMVFIVGTFLMRSVGCIINDFADRHWDKDVTRTADRPLTTGKVSVLEAVILAVILAGIALALVLTLNHLVLWLAFVAIALAATYPFLKRWTQLPQIGLSMAFNWAIIMAFAAELGGIPMSAWLVFLAFAPLPIAYDTYYAMVDKDDDVLVGIKSTAILFGRFDRLIVLGLQLISLVLLVLIGVIYHLNAWYDVALWLTLCSYVYQFYSTRERDREACFKAFLNNHYALLFIFIGVFLGFLQ